MVGEASGQTRGLWETTIAFPDFKIRTLPETEKLATAHDPLESPEALKAQATFEEPV